MQPEPNAVSMPQITEEDLVNSGPRVRALLVARLEAMWEPVHVRLQQDRSSNPDEPPVPIDPRLLEIGLRIVKEEATLYRLLRAPLKLDDEDDQPMGAGVDRAALVEAKLVEIEERLKHNSQK